MEDARVIGYAVRRGPWIAYDETDIRQLSHRFPQSRIAKERQLRLQQQILGRITYERLLRNHQHIRLMKCARPAPGAYDFFRVPIQISDQEIKLSEN